MPAEQQLERSVLERKERDELRAIAQAMSLQTNSRSKKADIIDSILRAAGVEVDAAANATKSNGTEAKRPRKAASTATVDVEAVPDTAEIDPVSTNGSGSSN